MMIPRRTPRALMTLSLALFGGGSALLAMPAIPASAATCTANCIDTVAGNGTAGTTGNGGYAVNAELNTPTGDALDASGNLYIADSGNNQVRKVVNPLQFHQDIISTIAGNGTRGYSGDGSSATSAELNAPSGLAVDASGDVFIADSANNRVRVVAAKAGTLFGVAVKAGDIYTVAGTGSCSKLANGGAAKSASLCIPTGVALYGGNLYISDTGHFEVRVVNSSGTINDFAGNGSFGSSGNGGAATSASFELPTGIAADSTGDIVIADSAGDVVRYVAAAKGTFYGQPMKAGDIYTIAGTGSFGFDSNEPATSAKLAGPSGVGVDQLGDVYISDTLNNRVREVNLSDTITTAAGNGTRGFSGDLGPATSAELNTPTGAVAMNGSAVYFSDSGNQRVREISSGPPPVLPETNLTFLFPIAALMIVGGGALFVIIRRRRNPPTPVAAA